MIGVAQRTENGLVVSHHEYVELAPSSRKQSQVAGSLGGNSHFVGFLTSEIRSILLTSSKL